MAQSLTHAVYAAAARNGFKRLEIDRTQATIVVSTVPILNLIAADLELTITRHPNGHTTARGTIGYMKIVVLVDPDD